MTLAHAAREWVRSHAGLDIQRYPQSDPLYGVSRLVRHLEVDLVLDVGANDGGYARSLRGLGYSGAILSFEPLSKPFARLRVASQSDPFWEVVRCAVGDREGDIVVHVAGNDEASSSVLPMLSTHTDAAPTARYVADETVPVHRLDNLVADRLHGRRCLLKMDVQGFERAVLDGAPGVLRCAELLAVQAEMSLVPLYEGGMLWRETVDRMEDSGFDLAALLPGFTDQVTGRLYQADGVFVRTP